MKHQQQNIKEQELNSTHDQNKCPFCNGRIVLVKSGYTCAECGSVIERKYTTECYFFENHGKFRPRHSKQYVSLSKQIDTTSHLGSYIGHFSSENFTDAFNKPIPFDKQKSLRRLKFSREFQTRYSINGIRYRIVKTLRELTSYFKIIPDVRKRAMYLYTKIEKIASRNSIRIPNHVSLIASCLYLATREFSFLVPISIHEICNAFHEFGHRVSCGMIIRDVLKFKQYVDLKPEKKRCEGYIDRLLNKMRHSDELKKRYRSKTHRSDYADYILLLSEQARKMAGMLPPSIKNSRNPFVLAGAIIYCADMNAANIKKWKRVLTQKILSRVTGLPEYSIRDHYNSLLKPIFFKSKKKSTNR